MFFVKEIQENLAVAQGDSLEDTPINHRCVPFKVGPQLHLLKGVISPAVFQPIDSRVKWCEMTGPSSHPGDTQPGSLPARHSPPEI